jgi:hypothetical protein
MTTERSSDTRWGARVVLVLPAVGDLMLQPIEANVLLEIAYVAMAIDRDVADAEKEAFRSLALRIRGLVDPDAPPLSELDLSTLIETFARRAPAGREVVRIGELASQLSSEALKHLGFQVAFAMTLVDFDTAPEEIELEAAVRDAFGISTERSAELRDEVFRKIGA